MHRVVVLVLDGVIPFELGIPARIFGRAEGADGQALYEVTTCSLDGAPVATDADFDVVVGHGAEALALADTVVVPASYRLGAPYEEGRLSPELADAFARIPHDARLVSICTGSYVLAAAGVLDGKLATTHWCDAEHFQRTFPAVRVDPDVLFVDEGRVLTSAGVASGVDLCLHIVRRDFGSDVANRVARRCVVPPWRDGGQAQFIERPVPVTDSESTAAARRWALEHLGESVTLGDLAAQAGTSVRTFARRFVAETGTTPAKWVTARRVDRARHLLETTDLPVDAVAHAVGFGSGVSLRQHMATILGVPPSVYRSAFRNRLDDGPVRRATNQVGLV